MRLILKLQALFPTIVKSNFLFYYLCFLFYLRMKQMTFALLFFEKYANRLHKFYL